MFAMGCGKAEQGSTTASEEAVALPPMQQLKGLSDQLRADLNSVMQPIQEVESIVNDAATMPARLQLNVSALSSVLSAKVSGTEASLSADLAGRPEVKAEIDALCGRVDATVKGLKEIPARVGHLVKRCGETLVMVPVLATKVTTSANMTMSSPFASAEAKATAQADLAAIVTVKTDIETTIREVQTQISALPNLATDALAKLSMSFAS